LFSAKETLSDFKTATKDWETESVIMVMSAI